MEPPSRGTTYSPSADYDALEDLKKRVWSDGHKYLRRMHGSICTDITEVRNGRREPKEGTVIGRLDGGQITLSGERVKMPGEVRRQIDERAKKRRKAELKAIPFRLFGVLLTVASGTILWVYFIAHGSEPAYVGDDIVAWLLTLTFFAGLASTFFPD